MFQPHFQKFGITADYPQQIVEIMSDHAGHTPQGFHFLCLKEFGLKLALFREIECPYQAARTAWLLGDAEQAEAERDFAALGATPPALEAAVRS